VKRTVFLSRGSSAKFVVRPNPVAVEAQLAVVEVRVAKTVTEGEARLDPLAVVVPVADEDALP
jgi:hypothetical protein